MLHSVLARVCDDSLHIYKSKHDDGRGADDDANTTDTANNRYCINRHKCSIRFNSSK